jgi:hypothetical protein
VSGNDDGNLSLTETDAITSQIKGHIFKLGWSFDSFPSPLRLRSISLSVFSELLCTPMYQKLSASDSHVRISYNSVTRILAVQCMTTPVHDAAQPFMASALYASAILQPVRCKICVVAGTDFLGFAEPYGGSTKHISENNEVLKIGKTWLQRFIPVYTHFNTSSTSPYFTDAARCGGPCSWIILAHTCS